MYNKEYQLLTLGDVETTQLFLNDLLELSKKYKIEFHNGVLYRKEEFIFGEQYIWSPHGIEIEDLLA